MKRMLYLLLNSFPTAGGVTNASSNYFLIAGEAFCSMRPFVKFIFILNLGPFNLSGACGVKDDKITWHVASLHLGMGGNSGARLEHQQILTR